MPTEITLKVNGRIHNVNVEPETPLLYVLRNDLGLKGAKFACGLEQCGACTIIIDGDAVPSCRIPVRSVQGRDIVTIEGIGDRDNLHPIQQAFIDEQAVQCGFCTSGMIMRAKALLDRNPTPSDVEIKATMSDNLCRCGVYDRILRAIKRASGQNIDVSMHMEIASGEPGNKSGSEVSLSTDGLAGSLMHTPELDSWIRINTDETITVFTGKVELGQDIRTSVAMIAAEELEVSIDRIRVVMGDTEQTPNEGYTAGSMSIETTGNAIRNAAAEARQIMLSCAAERFNASIENLRINDGFITDSQSGKVVSYWGLFGGKKFEKNVMGIGILKSPDDYRIVGQTLGRFDILAKVRGKAQFIHDLDLPDMVHGRVVRPPDYGSTLVSVNEDEINQMPGVIKLVRDGSFLAIIAEREEQAVEAMKRLKMSTVWKAGTNLPSQSSMFEYLLDRPSQSNLIIDGKPVDDPIPEIKTPRKADQTLSSTFFRPYHMHASLGPSAAAAQLIDGKLTVWSHSQGPYPLRAAIAQVFKMHNDDIRVIHMDGPGCYGHNGADDVGMDAALLARALPGRPVLVKWMRDDENKWEPYGPAMIMKTQASLNKDGKIIDWNYDVYSPDHTGRPRPDKENRSGLMPAWYLEDRFEPMKPGPGRGPHGGAYRNADPLYDFANRRIVNHFLPESPLRVSALRGLGSYANVFAIESFMDELAYAAGIDPVEFRLSHLKDERARDVIKAAAEKSEWKTKQGMSTDGMGQGIGFSQYKNRQSYVAVVVNLSVNKDSGQIILKNATIAADAGQLVNPHAVSSQLEGAFLQSASWTLKEQVRFDRQAIISTDWHSYPILRFKDSPDIKTVLINRPGKPYLGVGEGAMGPIPAAIANAVFDAVGIRLRMIPFTPEQVKKILLTT